MPEKIMDFKGKCAHENINWVLTDEMDNKEYSVEILKEFRKRFHHKRQCTRS